MDVLDAIRARRSSRAAFDPDRPVPERALAELIEAARWAPTAHNMQNFELVVVRDRAVLDELGAIEAPVSPVFVRENLRQLSFSPEELRARGRGILASSFPPAWLDPHVDAAALPASHLRDTMRGAPLVIVVAYDPRERAPASEGDVLGMMSLGCVLENLWLAAVAHGLAFHVMSTFASPPVAAHVRRVLAIPEPLAIAYAIRVGVAVGAPDGPRVRRAPAAFVHRERMGSR